MGDQNKAEQELITASKVDPENEELLNIIGNFYGGNKTIDEMSGYTPVYLRKSLTR